MRLLILRRRHQIYHEATVIVAIEMNVLGTVAFELFLLFSNSGFCFQWSLGWHRVYKLGIKHIPHITLPALIAVFLRTINNLKIQIICKLCSSVTRHTLWTRAGSLAFIIFAGCLQVLLGDIILVYAWLNCCTMALRRLKIRRGMQIFCTKVHLESFVFTFISVA